MGLGDAATEDLLARARSGEDLAVQELLARYRDRLRQMVSVRMDPRLSARVDPSDVVQDAMAAAIQQLPAYLGRGDDAFYPWLRQIAVERLIDAHRRHVGAQRRSIVREEHRNVYMSDASTLLLAERIAASGTSPSGRAMRAERKQWVRAALDRLEPEEREIVILRHLEQMPHKEIAAVLEVTPEAARSRYRRAMERLAALLTDTAGGMS
jgi:RNA polymerase sigma-70 factor (ECF subfamily)